MNDSIYILKNYILHRIKARGRHSLHSPFVFDLYESCVSDPAKSSFKESIEKIRKDLLADHSTIKIEDMGAGSRVNNSAQRKINQVAKHSLKSAKEAQFLACLCQKIDARKIIELGTSFGITTAYVAKNNPQAQLHSVEGSPEIAAIAKVNLKELEISNTTIYQGNFDVVFPELLKEVEADIIFIDGNHSKEATLRYFEMALDHINKKGLIVFDDIYWSIGMTEAWQSIIKNSRVSISIDFFHLGVVSLNEDYTKQDFKLLM